MHHLVALLNPLSCPLTQEHSQVTLEDMGMGMGGGVGGGPGHVFLPNSRNVPFVSELPENTSVPDAGYSVIHLTPVSLLRMSKTANFNCDKCNKSPGTSSSC